MKLDKTAQKALNAHIEASKIEQLKHFISNANPIAVIFWGALLVALCTMALFEMNNAGSGFQMLAKGAAPGWLAYCLGAGAVLAYIAAHHKASENWRNRKTAKTPAAKNAYKASAFKYATIALIATLLSFVGVLSNVSSKTALSSNAATEANVDRALLRSEVQALQAEATPEAVLQAEVNVGVITRQIVAREDEFTGWGLGTATEEECRADLKLRPREICNSLNGDGEGNIGLRNELELAKARYAGLKSKSDRLQILRQQLAGTTFAEGNAHFEAMSKIAGGNFDEDDMRIYVSLFISLGLLIILGIGFDAVFERVEDEYEEDLV